MFLCPAFFTAPVFPLESQCPVMKSVTTLSAGSRAWSTQYTAMLHELVRIYLGTYLEPPVDVINDVLALEPGDSVINMGSYAWYAVCESSLSLPLSLFFRSVCFSVREADWAVSAQS